MSEGKLQKFNYNQVQIYDIKMKTQKCWSGALHWGREHGAIVSVFWLGSIDHIWGEKDVPWAAVWPVGIHCKWKFTTCQVWCISPSPSLFPLPLPSLNSWLIFDLKLLWTAPSLCSSIATRLNILCYSASLMASTQLLPLLVCLHRQRSAVLEPDHWNSSNHNFNSIIIVLIYVRFAAYWFWPRCVIKNIAYVSIRLLVKHEVIMPNSPCLLVACTQLHWPLSGRGHGALRAHTSLQLALNQALWPR